MSEARSSHAAPPAHGRAGVALLLGALGVVYGDIGTSPLYALKECFDTTSAHHVAPSPENVLGILSLIFWSLTMVVAIKYLTFIMQADNQGEGGILALLALLPAQKKDTKMRHFLVLLVLFGSALLYGDGVITPAISVLSAVEGLEIATTKLAPVVIPLTCAILVVLFLYQKNGTEKVGRIFGPIMLVWFGVIATLGVVELRHAPEVLLAIDPRHAAHFFLANKLHGFFVLGAVVLCITGGEALYADMGHFGKTPIRRTWFFLVFPALLLNYFGQGALLLHQPEAISNPFYALVPGAILYPVVALSTMATVVASQALISGAFSLTQQAMQLGYFPRVTVVHTSRENEGQIYIPEINRALLVSCLWLVISFKSSSALAAAYGIAVTGTMGITTIVYFFVTRELWKWPLWKSLPLLVVFLSIDLTFFISNTAKFLEGGWFPVALAIAIFTVMTTWKTGRRDLARAFVTTALPLDEFIARVERDKPDRVGGTGVFLASAPGGTPLALIHHLKHNRVLHDEVLIVSVIYLRQPEATTRRSRVESLGQGFYRVELYFGYSQSPDIPAALAVCECAGERLHLDPEQTSYYVGRETLLPTGPSPMMRWRKSLFALLARNAPPATDHFHLPPNRVVELGVQVDF